MSRESPLILPQALLFDMDGTLTVPCIDFPRLKQEMGVGNRPILEALAEMDSGARAAAEAVLLRHEEIAAANSVLNDGCESLMRWIARRNIPAALITRNSRKSVQTFLERHGLHFNAIITRENPPHKPAPDPLLRACRLLNVPPQGTWMIGDGQYDIEAGLAAGIRTVHVSHGQTRAFAAQPWRTVRDLAELTNLLEECQN